MERINKDSIYEILEPAGRAGMHIESITLHLINRFSEIFDEQPLERLKVKQKVKRILTYYLGVRFARVNNSVTGKTRKGRYRTIKRRN